MCIGSKLAKLAGFTAAEIRVFTLVFSRYGLKDVLPQAEYDMWMHWVDAVTLLSRPVVSEADLRSGQAFLESFARDFKKLHGTDAWFPNLHFVFHVIEDIRNFGSVWGYVWCAQCISSARVFLFS